MASDLTFYTDPSQYPFSTLGNIYVNSEGILNPEDANPLRRIGYGIQNILGNLFGSDSTGVQVNGTNVTAPQEEPSFWFKTIGQGKNATTPAQIGLNAGLGLLGLWNQNKQWEDQLEEARKQFAFSKSMSQSNFMNQGTNFLNQSLFQLEGLNAFNPNAGAERAQNLNAAVEQLNNAASNIGLNGAFNSQKNALEKYNVLAGK